MDNRLHAWEAQLQPNSFPAWSDLPDLELYMDQVVLFLSRHLAFLSLNSEEEKIVTPSIINNYVRLKIMPSPIKKRYGRVHLAYLLMICTLKQSLSIAAIRKILPPALSPEEVEAQYTAFVELYRTTAAGFAHQVRHTLADNDPRVLPAATGLLACLAKSLTNYMLDE